MDDTRLSSYDYSLPERLIAQSPVSPRDSSKLFVVDRASGSFTHSTFNRIGDFLPRASVLVANNSRVFRARLLGHRVLPTGGGGKVECFLLKKIGSHSWEALMRASGSIQSGFRFDVIGLHGKLSGEVTQGGEANLEGGVVWVKFDRDPIVFGQVPLPPYISRSEPHRSESHHDEAHYQTVYSKESGSSAAPTAGLHFTEPLIEHLKTQGHSWQEITLHVGLGTFRPVKSDDIREHSMHEEEFSVSEETSARVLEGKRAGKKIVAIGTTSVRALIASQARFGNYSTRLFLHPTSNHGSRPDFAPVDAMVTNFHLPKSSLLMLICAFAGRELVFRAYKEAILRDYRFYSFGDAMLIL